MTFRASADVLGFEITQKDCLTHPFVPEPGRNAITVFSARIQSLQMSSHLIKNSPCPVFFLSPKQMLGLSLAPWLILICLLSFNCYGWTMVIFCFWDQRNLHCQQRKKLLTKKLMCTKGSSPFATIEDGCYLLIILEIWVFILALLLPHLACTGFLGLL